MEPIATETPVGLSDTGSQTDKWLSVEVIEPKIRKKRGRPPVRKYTNEVAGMVADAKQVGGTHYVAMKIQPWDALQAWLTPDQFKGYLLGTAQAYFARFNADAEGKGGIMDVKKGIHCLEKLVEVLNAEAR